MPDHTPNQTISTVLENLEAALKRGDTAAAVALFQPDCYWRDLVAFTWNIKTMEGRDQIAAMLDAPLPAIKPLKLRLDDREQPTEADGLAQAWITLETDVARGNGFIRVKDGLIWTLLTTMAELKGYEEPKGGKRPMGAEHGARTNRTSWKERLEAEGETLGRTQQPYCLVVGGGQGGIALGARLRQLGVPSIIIDKNAR